MSWEAPNWSILSISNFVGATSRDVGTDTDREDTERRRRVAEADNRQSKALLLSIMDLRSGPTPLVPNIPYFWHSIISLIATLLRAHTAAAVKIYFWLIHRD